MWLRSNEVNILKYLPDFLQSDINFKSVGITCSSEHEKIRLMVQDVFKQFFIETATWGLSRYERILDIVPKTNDDYTARRNRILSRYQANQTTTVAFLETLVKRYLSSDSIVNVVPNNPDYSFRIITTGGKILYAADMVEAVNLYKPAHLNYSIAIKRQGDMNVQVGILQCKIGKKTIKLPTVPISEITATAGVVHIRTGLKSIGIPQPAPIKQNIYSGIVVRRAGKITIGGIK